MLASQAYMGPAAGCEKAMLPRQVGPAAAETGKREACFPDRWDQPRAEQFVCRLLALPTVA